jgi:outer membrane protein TolC
VRLVRVRYENGLATMVALLDAQAALNRSRSDAASAAAGVASALAELKFRSGLLLDGSENAARSGKPETIAATGGRR